MVYDNNADSCIMLYISINYNFEVSKLTDMIAHVDDTRHTMNIDNWTLYLLTDSV